MTFAHLNPCSMRAERDRLARGASDARRLQYVLRGGGAPADLLYSALECVRASGDCDRLRGLCRELQLRLEHVA